MSIENSNSSLYALQRRGAKNERCPRCGKGQMIVDNASGEQICSNCGYVVKDRIEEAGPEWRSFQQDSEVGRDPRRTGVPATLAMHDMGLSTVIGLENTDASGRSLQASMKTTVERLRTWDRRSQVHESVDRNLRQAFSELDRLAEKLNASDAAIEKAAYIYRKAIERKLIRGRSISGLIAASLYAAFRNTETPRTLKDVAAVANIKKKELARSYRLLLREMDLRMPVADPIKCVSRIASKAGVTEKTKRRSIEILRKAQETRTSAGKDPMGLAASALYVACVMENEAKTQKDIAEAAGVTEVTIRNRYKGLKEALRM